MEQEFFEAFKLIECEKCNDKYCTHCGKVNYPTCCSRHPHIEITPEIVLKLEEIIIDKYFNLILNKAKDNYPYQYETKDLFTDWCKTKEEALLSLCIGYKHEIQDQVRALFND